MKSKIVKIVLIIVIVLVLIKLILASLGKYSSSAIADSEIDAAFFIINQTTEENNILLGEVVPSDDDYIYTFKVSNFKQNKISEVDLEYSISLITTTNLPLEYKLYKNDEELSINSEIFKDDDGTYFKRLNVPSKGNFKHSNKQSDVYKLVVTFASEYKNDYKSYEGSIESVRVIIDAKQEI